MGFVSRASLAEGLAAMSVNPLRTVLSTVGIVMGIASVIGTLALADGLDQYARKQIAAQTDVQSITITSRTQQIRDGFAFPNGTYPIFGLRDADELRGFLGAGAQVTMTVAGSAVVTTPTAPAHAASVTATLSNYLLFGVRVRGRALTTVGVMPAYLGETGYQVYIPLRAAAAALGVRENLTPALYVRAPSIETVDATKDNVIEWLATRYRDWDRQVQVATALGRLDQLRTAMVVLRLIMAAFASISLVVGGVGIMNVLLASVVERTREIGVRKALGARRRDILVQFLTESVAIASVGTGLGTAIGFILAFSVAALVRWQVPGAQLRAAVTSSTIVTSVLSAASVGLVFGTFPALRAARLSPIDAIRHD